MIVVGDTLCQKGCHVAGNRLLQWKHLVLGLEWPDAQYWGKPRCSSEAEKIRRWVSEDPWAKSHKEQNPSSISPSPGKVSWDVNLDFSPSISATELDFQFFSISGLWLEPFHISQPWSPTQPMEPQEYGSHVYPHIPPISNCCFKTLKSLLT